MSKRKSYLASAYLVGLSGEIGVKLALPIATGVAVGARADKYFGTSPLITLVSTALAFVVGWWLIVRMIRHYQNQTL